MSEKQYARPAQPLPHVLLAAREKFFQRILSEALDMDGYPVTLAPTADEAFAVARASLHPLLLIADHTMVLFTWDFLPLFTDHADQLPHIEWVTVGVSEYPENRAQAYFAEREAEHLPFRLTVAQFFAAVERAAQRLLTVENASRA